MGIPLTFVADALAPGLPVAQAIGRLGNWFNNELYGKETTLPWGLEIHEPDVNRPGEFLRDPESGAAILKPGLFHPTFLYELLWNLGVAVLVWLADRRYNFGKGRAFALYVMAYTAGRAWIEALRVDEAEEIGGLRLNVWVSIVVFLGALAYFLRVKGPQEYLLASDGGYRSVTREEFEAGAPADAEASESASADAEAAEESTAAADDDAAEASADKDPEPDDAPRGDPADKDADEEVRASAEARSGDER